MALKKYLQLFRISWQNAFVYRLNFIMWRVRTVLWFFTSYFFWVAIYSQHQQVFSYDRSVMLTYIIGAALLRSFVLASRSITAGEEIANGDLNNYLVKPLNYLTNWLARDFADKALNLVFFSVELGLIILLFKPPLVFPPDAWHLLAFLLTVFLAMFIYFFFSFLVSLFTFWYPEHNGWPLRFIVFVMLTFLAGESFPLDMFPAAAQTVFRLLPFSYLIFYPLQIYLGRLAPLQIIEVFAVMIVWLLILYLLVKKIYQRGLKIYGAYGR